MKTPSKYLSLSCVLLTLACTAKGATTLYNVDLGSNTTAYAGQGLLGGVSDTTWTKAAHNSSGLALSTSTGGNSTATLTNSGFDGTWSAAPNFAGWNNFGDYIYAFWQTSGHSLTISGLDSGDAFTFYLYTQSGTPTYSVTANINGGTAQSTTASILSSWVLAPASPSNSIAFTGIVPIFGNLVVNITQNQGYEQNINGFQLQVVSAIPEPSTYAAFAGLGALGLAARRRRRA